MGTGTTSWDGCRIGTANVGDLIHAYTNKSDIDYQRKMCSGDTTVGLNRQIDEWSNPERADIATVTAGGNDVGFTDILWYCVLAVDAHIILWHFPSYYKKYCNEMKEKGRRMMEDSSENGLKAKLVAAYKKMLEKSKREVGATPTWPSSPVLMILSVLRISTYMSQATQAASGIRKTSSQWIARTQFSTGQQQHTVLTGTKNVTPTRTYT